MLRYYTKHTPGEEFTEVHVPPPEGGVWVYAEQPTDQDLHDLIERYKLDPNIVNDLHDQNELPRVEYSGGSLYVFLRTASRTKHGEVITAPLLAIMTPKAFLVLNSTNVLTVHKIIRALMHADVRTSDMGALLVGVLAATIADYEVLIHRTGKYIKDTGHRLRNHEVNNSDFVHFVTVEDNLSEYALNLNEMLVVAERLNENKHFPLKTREAEALNDTILHTKQLLSSVISLGSTITSIRNAYSTIANNSLNLRMKTLTVLTVLIALPNVFYGMYGMNVPLPFQNAPWAYGAIVIFTFTLILGVYAIAKRFRVF